MKKDLEQFFPTIYNWSPKRMRFIDKRLKILKSKAWKNLAELKSLLNASYESEYQDRHVSGILDDFLRLETLDNTRLLQVIHAVEKRRSFATIAYEISWNQNCLVDFLKLYHLNPLRSKITPFDPRADRSFVVTCINGEKISFPIPHFYKKHPDIGGIFTTVTTSLPVLASIFLLDDNAKKSKSCYQTKTVVLNPYQSINGTKNQYCELL